MDLSISSSQSTLCLFLATQSTPSGALRKELYARSYRRWRRERLGFTNQNVLRTLDLSGFLRPENVTLFLATQSTSSGALRKELYGRSYRRWRIEGRFLQRRNLPSSPSPRYKTARGFLRKEGRDAISEGLFAVQNQALEIASRPSQKSSRVLLN